MAETAEEQQRFEGWVREVLEVDAGALANRWLDHLVKELPEAPSRVFPTRTLLNHIPSLVMRIANLAFSEGDTADHRFVEREVRQLANMRRAQGYDIDELQAELDLLSELVLTHLEARLQSYRVPVSSAVAVAAWRRLHGALDQLSRRTARAFHEGVASDRLDRARLLQSFCRAMSHELRDRLNVSQLAIQVAAEGLRRGQDGTAALEKLQQTLMRAETMVEDVHTVAATHGAIDLRTGLGQDLHKIANDVAGNLAALAIIRGVRLEVDPHTPTQRVDAGRVQLILVFIVANAIKLADPDERERWIRIGGAVLSDEQCEISVEDNGLAIPPELQEALFEGDIKGPAGQRIGLSLAQRAADQLSTAISVESTAKGSRWSFTVRQAGDRLAAPIKRTEG